MPNERVAPSQEADSNTTHSRLSEQHPVTAGTIWEAISNHWRPLATLAGIGLVLGAIPGLVKRRPFTSESSFASQARSTNAVSAIAAQFGVQAGGDPVQSPAFYADLVTSRVILEPVLSMHLAGMRPGIATLEQQLVPNERDAGKRHHKAFERLKSQIRAVVNSATSVVTLKVTTDSPYLSQQVGLSLIDAINKFNLQRRRERAAQDRMFAEQQFADADSESRAAESRLATFLEENHTRDAPRLSIDEERLRRDVSSRQQLATSLLQDYQTAKINGARSDPAISVIDPPELPTVGDSRGTIIGALLGMFAGGILGLAFFYGRDFLESRKGLSGHV